MKESNIAGNDKGREFPRANREITAKEVRVVDASGEMVGVIPIRDAIKMAEEAGLDLVEVSPNAEPPVCKIIDFGKYKYEAQKKAHEAKKKQKIIEIKEIKLRPNIGQNDYDVKLKNIIRFIKEGDKVKITLKFRGREVTHQEVAFELFKRIQEDIEDIAKIEFSPKMEGKQMLMILAPL